MNAADISALYLLACLLLSVVNFLLLEKALYRIYHILWDRNTFTSKLEKFGFYLHGILAYIGGMALVMSPLLFTSLKYGLAGTGFIVVLRLLLKGKL